MTRYIVFALLSLWPVLLWAQPSVGTACSGSGNNVLTQNIPCTSSGANTFVFIAVTLNPKAHLVTAINYGGVTPTLVLSIDNSVHDVELRLYRLINPATGLQTLQVDYSGFTNSIVSVLPMSNVHQTVPLGTAVSAEQTSPTSTATVNVVSAATELVVDVAIFFFAGIVDIVPGAGQDEHLDVTNSDMGTSLGMSSKIGANPTTMSWTHPQTVDGSLNIAVSVKPVAASAARRRSGPMVFP